jgi:hypothetical protein
VGSGHSATLQISDHRCLVHPGFGDGRNSSLIAPHSHRRRWEWSVGGQDQPGGVPIAGGEVLLADLETGEAVMDPAHADIHLIPELQQQTPITAARPQLLDARVIEAVTVVVAVPAIGHQLTECLQVLGVRWECPSSRWPGHCARSVAAR